MSINFFVCNREKFLKNNFLSLEKIGRKFLFLSFNFSDAALTILSVRSRMTRR